MRCRSDKLVECRKQLRHQLPFQPRTNRCSTCSAPPEESFPPIRRGSSARSVPRRLPSSVHMTPHRRGGAKPRSAEDHGCHPPLRRARPPCPSRWDIAEHLHNANRGRATWGLKNGRLKKLREVRPKVRQEET